MSGEFDTALRELGTVMAGVDDIRLQELCRRLAAARQIGVYGCGREFLQLKGLAMRMFHLGMDVSVVGDMTMPALGAGDVFLVTSGPGETATVLTLMRVAKEAGASVLLITAQPRASAAQSADFTLVLPAQTMADDRGGQRTSLLPMGSLFEGALFLVFEVMVLRLKRLLGVSAEAMRARHTNME